MEGGSARAKRLAAINDDVSTGGAVSGGILWSVNVNAPKVNGVVTVYDGTSSFSTGATVIATIDTGVANTFPFWGARFPNGAYVRLSGSLADVTVIYE